MPKLLKRLLFTLPAALYLCLFLPVFITMILKGFDINYNPMHKLTLYRSNKELFMVSVIVFMIIALIMIILSKSFSGLNHRLCTGFTIFFIVFVSAGLYFANIYSAKRMGFYGGWDCGMIANSVRDIFAGGDMGYGTYYLVFTNNLPIMYLLLKLYEFAADLKNYPYELEFIWVQFQCLMVSLSVMLSAFTVFFATKKKLPTLFTLCFSTLIVGLTPWEVIPYTDVASIFLPIMLLFFYVLYCKVSNPVRYAFLALAIGTGLFGGILKATVYVALIAILLIETLRFIIDIKERFLSFGMLLISVLGFYVLGLLFTNNMYKTLNYTPDDRYRATWSNYLYMGLNEERTGASSGDGYDLIHENVDMDLADRKLLELSLAKERMKEKGVPGLIDFYKRKMIMTFNDGTFSWYKEGFFNIGYFDFEDLGDNKELLRDFYEDGGKYFINFCTDSQLLWIFNLFMVVLYAFIFIIKTLLNKNTEANLLIHSSVFTILTGMFLFIMLFEARSRYLLNYLPFYVSSAGIGMSELIHFSND